MKMYTTLLDFNDTYLFHFTSYVIRFYCYLRVTIIPENSIKQINFYIFELMILFYNF